MNFEAVHFLERPHAHRHASHSKKYVQSYQNPNSVDDELLCRDEQAGHDAQAHKDPPKGCGDAQETKARCEEESRVEVE
jgi:hypothetical protein